MDKLTITPKYLGTRLFLKGGTFKKKSNKRITDIDCITSDSYMRAKHVYEKMIIPFDESDMLYFTDVNADILISDNGSSDWYIAPESKDIAPSIIIPDVYTNRISQYIGDIDDILAIISEAFEEDMVFLDGFLYAKSSKYIENISNMKPIYMNSEKPFETISSSEISQNSHISENISISSLTSYYSPICTYIKEARKDGGSGYMKGIEKISNSEIPPRIHIYAKDIRYIFGGISEKNGVEKYMNSRRNISDMISFSEIFGDALPLGISEKPKDISDLRGNISDLKTYITRFLDMIYQKSPSNIIALMDAYGFKNPHDINGMLISSGISEFYIKLPSNDISINMVTPDIIRYLPKIIHELISLNGSDIEALNLGFILYMSYTNVSYTNMEIPKHLDIDMSNEIRRGLISDKYVLSLLDSDDALKVPYITLANVLYKVKKFEGGLSDLIKKFRNGKR